MDIETPMVPDDKPEGTLTAQPDEGRRKEGDSEAASKSEDEDIIDGNGRGLIENEYSDEEPKVNCKYFILGLYNNVFPRTTFTSIGCTCGHSATFRTP